MSLRAIRQPDSEPMTQNPKTGPVFGVWVTMACSSFQPGLVFKSRSRWPKDSKIRRLSVLPTEGLQVRLAEFSRCRVSDDRECDGTCGAGGRGESRLWSRSTGVRLRGDHTEVFAGRREIMAVPLTEHARPSRVPRARAPGWAKEGHHRCTSRLAKEPSCTYVPSTAPWLASGSRTPQAPVHHILGPRLLGCSGLWQ